MEIWHKISLFYKTLTWRDNVSKVLLALTVLFYPFNNFPFGPFAKLTFYPLLLLLVLNLDRIVQQGYEKPYLRYTAIAGGLWAIWMVVSLLLSIGFSAIGFEHIKAVSGAIRFFLLWYTFATCCFMFPREEIKRLFYWTFVVLLGACAMYSFVEYLHFAEVEWATKFLKHAIHCFIRTGITEWTGDNVWPPVLWDSERYRGIFEEPAYYSVLLGFATLFFAYYAWTSKRILSICGNLILVGIAGLLLCKTKSAAGAISLTMACGTWVVLALCLLFRMERSLQLKLGIFVIVFVVGSFFALTTQRHSTTNIDSLIQAIVSKDAAKDKTTRSIHLSAELKCIEASPIYGYGMGEYDRVMREALPREPYKTVELAKWLERKGAVPWLNWFTGLAVMYGLVGLTLFLAWFVFPLVVIWFKRVKQAPAGDLCLSAALGAFLVCQMTSANTEIFCYMLLMTIPILFVTSDAVSTTKKESQA